MAAPRSVETGSATSNSSHHDGRTRNARAQARHREKRKAYISQLEQTVQRLQASLALSPEQTASLPSPQARLRELEHENEQLRLEIAELRRQVLCGPSSSIDMRPGTANGSRHSPRSSSSAEYNDSYDGRIANGLGNKRKRSSHDDPNFVPRTPIDTPSSRAASLSRPNTSQGVPYLSLQTATPDYPLSSTPRVLPSPFGSYTGRDNYFDAQQSSAALSKLPGLSYSSQSAIPRSAQPSMHSDPHALSHPTSANYHPVSVGSYSHTVPSSAHMTYKREDDDAYGSGMAQTPTLYSHTPPASSSYYPSNAAPTNTATSPYDYPNSRPTSSHANANNMFWRDTRITV